MGKSITKYPKLRNGYYIEVRNRNQKSGIIIRNESINELFQAIKKYEKTKDVMILGKWKNGKKEKIHFSKPR